MSEESPNPPQETPAAGLPTVRLPQQPSADRSALSGWAVGLTGILALVLFGIAGLSVVITRPGHATTLAQVGTAAPTFTAQATQTSAPPTATSVPTQTPQPSPTAAPTSVPQHTPPTPTPVPTHVPTPAPTATPSGTPTPVPTPTCTAPITHYGSPTTLHGDTVAGGSGLSATIGTLTVEIVVQQTPDGHGGCIPTDAQEMSIIYVSNAPETSGTACTSPPHACYVQGTLTQTSTSSGTSTPWTIKHTIDTGPFHGTVPGGDDTKPQQGSGQQCVSGQAFYLDNFGQQHDAAPALQYCWTE